MCVYPFGCEFHEFRLHHALWMCLHRSQEWWINGRQPSWLRIGYNYVRICCRQLTVLSISRLSFFITQVVFLVFPSRRELFFSILKSLTFRRWQLKWNEQHAINLYSCHDFATFFCYLISGNQRDCNCDSRQTVSQLWKRVGICFALLMHLFCFGSGLDNTPNVLKKKSFQSKLGQQLFSIN